MTPQERTNVIRALLGLLKIARIAMPDTYYQSDRRVKRALGLMANLQKNLKGLSKSA